MSKQASSPETRVNYPNVLGAITDGQLLNIGLLQVAVATRPPAVNAGKPFDAIVFFQNAANIEMDAVVRLILPARDLAGKAGRFSTKLTKPVLIGLRPGEVSYATMPITIGHQAAPGEDYALEVEIQVEPKGRAPSRVRDVNGGASFDIEDLEHERKPLFEHVQNLNYSVEIASKEAARGLPIGPASNKLTLIARFTVLPATVAGLPTDLKPGYVTLWTDADYRDAAWLTQKARPMTDKLLPQINRYTAFFPLLKYTQERFEAAGYRLWAGEAVMITKLLVLILEMGAEITIAGRDEPLRPRWFTALCQALVRRPSLASPEHIGKLTEKVYTDLIYDAATLGFTMLGTVTSEEFGTPAEIEAFIERLVGIVETQSPPLDLKRVYLPLVLAGLVANTRITMPQEQVRESVHLLLNAVEKRANEKNEQTQFIFDLADDLIERAIEHF